VAWEAICFDAQEGQHRLDHPKAQWDSEDSQIV
jgi:hypothetical protein